MRIYESGFGGASGVGNTRSNDAVNAQSRSGGTGVGSTGSDHVDLSSTLGSLSRALSSFSTSRTERVQALAAQYQAGQYKTDAGALSHAMVGAAVAGGGGAAGGPSPGGAK
jgi:flagellar biosynthesis anti-sigma factor FlgM